MVAAGSDAVTFLWESAEAPNVCPGAAVAAGGLGGPGVDVPSSLQSRFPGASPA